MKKFEGKKLLVLGTNVGSTDIVKYARGEGAKVYVADFNSPAKSEAKLHCDVPVLMSTADTEGLLGLVEKEQIDGVFAGVSEFNLLQAQLISKISGLRFYCTREQWNAIEDKSQFRKLCRYYGVPHPHTYYMGCADVFGCQKITPPHWPCVVKPVDGSSSLGVSICTTPENFDPAVRLAIDNSASKQIIVEDYFVGDEFAAHYTIVNGKAVLSSIDNRYPVAVHEGKVTTIPIARVYPSSFLEEYSRQVNDSVILLCNSLHLEVGVLFVQGLYNKATNKFCIFEGGLRSAGEAPYRLIERVNGINYMHHFIDYLLLGEVKGYNPVREDPTFGGHNCCVLSFVSKGGRVGSINGLEETVATLPSIIDHECRYPVGSDTPYGDTLRQIMLRFVLDCPSKEQLAQDINYINNHVTVLKEDRTPLCLTFDSARLFE